MDTLPWSRAKGEEERTEPEGEGKGEGQGWGEASSVHSELPEDCRAGGSLRGGLRLQKAARQEGTNWTADTRAERHACTHAFTCSLGHARVQSLPHLKTALPGHDGCRESKLGRGGRGNKVPALEGT